MATGRSLRPLLLLAAALLWRASALEDTGEHVEAVRTATAG